jgi:hypothetical protein
MKMLSLVLTLTKNGRGIVGRARPALAAGEVAPLYEPNETKIESIICNGRQKRPRPVKTIGLRPEQHQP